MSLAGASRHWIPAATLLGTLALTVVAAIYVTHATRNQERFKFQRTIQSSVHEVEGQIESRLSSYIAILRGGSGLFSAEGVVPRARFRRYVDRLNLKSNYAGVIGVGFAPRITAGEAAHFVDAAHLDGLSQFHIWPVGERESYFPVFYLETGSGTRPTALGYDMYSDPVRRRAMNAACDEGGPAATGRVLLVGEPTAQAGFLIYVPIYRSGDVPATVAERRSSLLGFVYSPFRCDDLLKNISDASDSAVHFAAYDGTPSLASLLYASSAAVVAGAPNSITVPMAVSGVNWTLVFAPRAELIEDGAMTQGIAVLGVGIAISMGLFALTLAQARARAAAEQAMNSAEQTSVELRRSEEALRISLNYQRRGEEDRARLLESEKAARAEAESANRSKDEFLATLSHELRTPLNAILGWAQLLRMGGMEPDETDRGLETIERNARVQAQLVEDLLDVSRIISGKIRLDLRPIELPAVIEAALDSVRPAAAAKRIRLVPVLDAHAGPVMGDADRLQQVVWNLLSNAIKFTPADGRVEVYLQRVQQEAEIAVCDSGQGIAPEFLPFVFERLRQADGTSTRRHGGLGLGLAIVRHLVELHGGSVTVRSRGVNTGATFSVLLPVALARKASEIESRDADAVVEARSGRLAGLKILVVEDEPDARELLNRVLSLAGAKVALAASANEAIREFELSTPQVLISDIGMPEEDGYSLIRKIRMKDRREGGRVAALALTAFAREEDRAAASAAGFDAHMAKPFDPNDLVDATARLSRRPDAQRPEPATGVGPL